MPAPTALQRFLKTIDRSHDLIKLYISLAQKGAGESHPAASDVVRGAIVLAVAAMDQYFTRRFVEMLNPYLKANGSTHEIVKLLQKAGLDTEQALIMASMDRPYRRIRTLVDNYLAKYTTQRFEVIDELFVCFGLKDLTKHASAKTKKTHTLTKVTALVTRRHAIVHDGDLNRHGHLTTIDPKRVLKQISALLDFVKASDEILENLES